MKPPPHVSEEEPPGVPEEKEESPGVEEEWCDGLPTSQSSRPMKPPSA
jgi:hypothetical protein